MPTLPTRRGAAAIAAALMLAVPALVDAAASPTPRFSVVSVMTSAGAEPNISISPSGRTVLVSALGPENPATLYRSTDYGRRFSKLAPTFSVAGGFDWDMRFLDERTVIATDLDLGAGIHVHRSTDAGSTWTSTTLGIDAYDRPWVEHFGSQLVYVVARGFANGIPYLYRSTDGGRSFSPPIPVLVYGTGGLPVTEDRGPGPVEAFVTNGNAYLDHIAVDPKSGRVYVLYGIQEPGADAANRLYVARLEGERMVSRPVHIGDTSQAFIAGFNWLAVDAAGTVYVLANGVIDGRYAPRLSYSKDGGRTWSRLVDLGARGGSTIYGSIAAGAKGVLSLVALRGPEESPDFDQSWIVEIARITGADSGSPRVYRTRPLSKAIHTEEICLDGIACGAPGGGDRALLDYIWNAIARDGTAYAVVASDGPATGEGEPSVLVFRQTGGMGHGRGAPS